MLRKKTGVLNLSHTTHGGGGYIRCLKNVRIIGLISTSLLTILALISIFPIINHEQQAEATPGVEEVPTIAIVVGKENASVDITPNSATGTFSASDTNSHSEFSVTTSNYTGYTLKIKASDDAGQLTNTSYNEKLDSITTAVDASTFETGSASTYANKWGYKPNYLNSATNTDFLPAPTTSETILDAPSTAMTRNYTIDVAARVDYTKPVGTYTNTYTLTAIANPVAYAIEYWDVTSDYDATTKKRIFQQVATPQASAINTTASVVLNPDNTPTRGLYTFAGWCYNPNHTIDPSVNDMVVFQNGAYHNPGTICDGGTIYNAGDTLLIDPTVDNTNIKLYAMWIPNTFDQAFAAAGATKAPESGYQYYKMQDMTTTICKSVPPDETTILVDYRPNKNSNTSTSLNVGTLYHVGRLPDGECWMLDNLDLNLNNPNVVNALTTANTHVNSASLTALKNGGGTDSNGRAQTALPYSNWGATNSYTQPLINRSGDCSTTLEQQPCTYNGSYTSNTVLSTLTGVTTQGIGYGKIGAFYNYCAATAGSYCYSTSASNTSSATYDICPYKWKLPKGDTSTADSFYALNEAINKISATPGDSTKPVSIQGMLSSPFAGRYYTGYARWQGQSGSFWSSTIDDAKHMYRGHVGPSAFGSVDSLLRSYGLNVRCIAQ